MPITDKEFEELQKRVAKPLAPLARPDYDMQGQGANLQDMIAEIEQSMDTGTTAAGLFKAFGRGAAEGLTTELPGMVGKAMEFVTPEAVKESVGDPGKALADWAETKAREWYGEAPRDLSEAERWVYEGTKMFAPSVVPAGILGTGTRAILGIGKTMKAARLAKTAGDTARYSQLLGEAQGAAKLANRVAGIGTAGIFGTSQAQRTIDTAYEQADKLEREGRLKEATAMREKAEGWAPWATGGIEAAGEYLGTKYLGKLFGLDEAEIIKRSGKKILTDFLKTLGVEVSTEVGQQAGQAAVEKYTAIRPEAEPIAEALEVIGPTAFMTLLTGGLGAGVRGLAGRQRTPEDVVDDLERGSEQVDLDIRQGAETIIQAAESDIDPLEVLRGAEPGARVAPMATVPRGAGAEELLAEMQESIGEEVTPPVEAEAEPTIDETIEDLLDQSQKEAEATAAKEKKPKTYYDTRTDKLVEVGEIAGEGYGFFRKQGKKYQKVKTAGTDVFKTAEEAEAALSEYAAGRGWKEADEETAKRVSKGEAKPEPIPEIPPELDDLAKKALQYDNYVLFSDALTKEESDRINSFTHPNTGVNWGTSNFWSDVMNQRGTKRQHGEYKYPKRVKMIEGEAHYDEQAETPTDLISEQGAKAAKKSYSGDVIDKGKIRKPFEWKGKLYVSSGIHYGGAEDARSFTVHELIPVDEYEGEGKDYEIPYTSEGREVAYGKKKYILGPDLELRTKPQQELTEQRKKKDETTRAQEQTFAVNQREKLRQEADWTRVIDNYNKKKIDEAMSLVAENDLWGIKDLKDATSKQLLALNKINQNRHVMPEAQELGISALGDINGEIARRGKQFFKDIGWPTDPKAEYRNLHSGSVETFGELLGGRYSTRRQPEKKPLIQWRNIVNAINDWEPNIGPNKIKVKQLQESLGELEGELKQKLEGPKPLKIPRGLKQGIQIATGDVIEGMSYPGGVGIVKEPGVAGHSLIHRKTGLRIANGKMGDLRQLVGMMSEAKIDVADVGEFKKADSLPQEVSDSLKALVEKWQRQTQNKAKARKLPEIEKELAEVRKALKKEGVEAEKKTPEAPEKKEEPAPKKIKPFEQFVSEVLAKGKAGISITEEIEVEETGQVLTAEKDVAVAIRDINAEIESYKQLMDCLQ